MRYRSLVLLLVAIVAISGLLFTLLGNNAVAGGNQSPVASFTHIPEFPMPNEPVLFDASSSYDPDGSITQYAWNFGDGSVTTTTNPLINHTYLADGTYTVELVVTDNNAAQSAAAQVIEVSTIVYFRVVAYGTIIPVSEVQVTVYYKSGSTWLTAPVGWNGLEIRYDNMTQPDLADTSGEKYRNPGYTASILRHNASNIGFDVHRSTWTVFFKFKYGSNVAYWPDDTTFVYTYNGGVIETHAYAQCHRAYWDPSASTYVIKVNNIPKDGVSPTSRHPIIIGIQGQPTEQHYLVVRTSPLGVTSIPGEGWHIKNTNVTLTAPSTVSMSSTSQYRFTYWDVDGASKGTGVNPVTVQMNTSHTATAHYTLQYAVNFTQGGLSLDSTGTIVTVDGAAKALSDMPYLKWIDNSSSVTYSYNSPVTSSTTGKRYRLNTVTGPTSPITLTGPATVTGNYVTQYQVTFAQSGLDSTATGTVVTVNGTAKANADLAYNWWVDAGSTVTYTYSSIVSSSTTDKQFRLVTVQCPPSQFVVTEPTTITGVYCCQYKVKFAHSGLDSTATGTVATVNGTAKTYSQLPYSIWVDSGSTVIYAYTTTVPSSSPTKQFRLSSVTGPTSPMTVTGSTTVTGNYVTQYQVTFTQSGLDSTATSTVVTINGSPKTYSNLPYSLWVDSGGSVTYLYSSPVSSSVSGKQFRLSSVSGPTSPITVTGSTTVTGCYVVQYQVTFAQSGLDSTATGTVVTVNGGAKSYGNLPYSLWVDSGSSLTYLYSSPVSSSVSGKQFRLSSVSGPTSPITVTGSITVTGNYIVQYQVTFTQTGLDSSATGTVVTVNSVTKGYAELPYSLWIDSGGTVTYTYTDPVLSSTSGKWFKLTSITGPASPITVMTSTTITGDYKTQYQVTFDQSGVGSIYTGTIVVIDSTNYNGAALPASFWWDSGSGHTFAFASPLTVNASVQYTWSSTSGLSTLQSGILTITASGSVTGNYIAQNCVTFDQVGVSLDSTGTVLIVDGTPYTASALPKALYWQLGTTHNFTFQSPLVVTPNSKQYVWTNTTGLSNVQSGSITITTFGNIIGHYKTQYYVNLATNPLGIDSPIGSGWYDSGTYANISTDQVVYGGSRYWFIGWTTADMAEITDPTSPSTTVLVDKAKTVTANYSHQYLITFAQSGLSSDATGTVATINGSAKSYGDLAYSIWVDEGITLTYSYEYNVSSSISGKKYVLTGVTGSSSPITVNTDTNITGNYKTQYHLTVSSPFGTTGGQGWYDSGATAYASLNTSNIDHGNGTRRVFLNWNGDASGTTYSQSNPITMNSAKTAVATWKTQYAITFAHSGLDSSATGTVVTVNSAPVTYSQLPYTNWTDSGGSVTYSYGNVSTSTPGKRFTLTGVAGPSSPITVTAPLTITGNYITQHQVVVNQTGVGSDYLGTVVTVDGNTYTINTLPASLWWDSSSTHSFSFSSPLVVNASKQYEWQSTTGLSTLQSDTVTVTTSGSIIGNYAAEQKVYITFAQTGVSSDFTGTVMTIDGINYGVTDLNVSFWWDNGSSHTFAYASPLVVSANAKQYLWTSASGLSTLQSGTLIATTSGSVTGNYKTQYYLTLVTSPPNVTSPLGAGWYDAGSNATISTSAYVDISPGQSRYRFNGWTTANMSEIEDASKSPTKVLVDEAKTVTANYVTQYSVYFNQSGIGPDYLGTVLDVDGVNYDLTSIPAPFWWDSGSAHPFAFQSPLTVNGKRYVWINTTGLSTLQSGTLTVANYGSIVGNYKTQYLLTVVTDPTGLSPQPSRNPAGEAGPTNGWWYDTSTSVTLTAPMISGHTFLYWDVNGTSRGSGVNPTAVYMNAPYKATAHYAIPSQFTVTISPNSATRAIGQPVHFTSSIIGGTSPYTYQWYLGNNPVAGATSNSWTFTPNASGIYYVYLRTTDANNNTAQSGTANVTVSGVAVGGYSISLARQTPLFNVAAYGTLITLLGLALSLTRRKRK